MSADPAAEIQRAKAALRAEMQRWRSGLDAASVAARSQRLAAHLLGHPLLVGRRVVLIYLALRREPQTAELAVALRARGAALAVPAVRGPDLEPRSVDAAGDLERALQEGEPLPLATLDLVLVPGLAFDRQGRRLGRGGGHYDRLLAQLPPGCLRIGLCFAGQVRDGLPAAPWDQPVDAVATEEGVRERGAEDGGRNGQ